MIEKTLFPQRPAASPQKRVQPVSFQPAQPPARPKYDADVDFTIRTELPDPERYFRRESETELRERIRKDARGQRIAFPEDQPVSKEVYVARQFPPLTEVVEPNFVLHGRLYFEQPNTERHGWDLGVLQPAVNLGVFYKDLVMLPYHFWARPLQRYETSAGKCLPGDPTPLLLYPPERSATGLLGEAGTILGLIFIFP